MKRLLLVSLRGGCGSTTVTANLAQALVKINKPVLAIDAVAENLLQLHLGLPFEEGDGWAARMAKQQAWNEAGFTSPHGVDFLPFGRLDNEFGSVTRHVDLQAFSQLGQNLREVANPSQWQLFHGELDYINQAALLNFIDSLDMMLVVLTADAINYTILQSQLENNRALRKLIELGKVRILLNHYQPETEIGRDFSLVLKHELQDILVPVMMHRDAVLAECAANLTTVQYYAPISQAAKDYQALAFWCVSSLADPHDLG